MNHHETKSSSKIEARPWVASLSLLLAGCIGANAAVIATNLGPGDSFDPTGFGIGNTGGVTYNNRGVSFTVGGSDFDFVSAEAALDYFSGTNAVTLGIRSDAAGLPGTLLQSFTVADIPSAGDGSVVLFNGVAPLVLSAGTTYWLTSEEYAPDDTFAGWRAGLGVGNAIRLNLDPWTITAQAAPAFRINGDPIAAAVPEPGTLSLAGLGAVGVLLHAYRRRRNRIS